MCVAPVCVAVAVAVAVAVNVAVNVWLWLWLPRFMFQKMVGLTFVALGHVSERVAAAVAELKQMLQELQLKLNGDTPLLELCDIVDAHTKRATCVSPSRRVCTMERCVRWRLIPHVAGRRYVVQDHLESLALAACRDYDKSQALGLLHAFQSQLIEPLDSLFSQFEVR